MINDYKISAPILFIAFNRPDITKITFDYIRKAKPSKLYVAVDGARQDKENEDKLIDQVKRIVENVNWKCDVNYKYNEANQGAEITVSSAVSWVLDKEEFVIVLEDDIVAPLAFLKFAQEMLIKYRNNEQVWMVAGPNSTPYPHPDKYDYFYSRYGHTWGWATWKRVWDKFDLNTEIENEYIDLNYLKNKTNSIQEAEYYKNLFSILKENGKGNNTWDYIFAYLRFINNAMSIVPRVNLTSNIGVYGLHARGARYNHFRPIDYHFKIQKHPEKIECYTDYDLYHFKKHIKQKNIFLRKIKNLESRIVGYKRLKKFERTLTIDQL